MTKPRLRFAPSPTGTLHIGNVRSALFNWLWARKTGGSFILRIEDTDQERSTEASVQVIYDDLKWLGMDWDEGPGVGGASGPYTQMERLALYQEYAEKLIASGHAFRCYCTKEELDAQREALKKKDPKAQFKYPGTCRDRAPEPNLKNVVRFKAPRDGAVVYTDKVFGEITTPNIENQDFVLLRSDGIPLYNFGVVVDDVTMGITLVARGRDHMINTPPQILLYQAFGAPIPEFAHLPMMLAPNGEKLSKRHGAVSVGEYREKGYAPAAVLNYLARFGWSHGDKEIFSVAELIQDFSWDDCGRGDGKADDKKFLAIDHEHLKAERLVPTSDYVERVVPFLSARGLTVEKAAVERAVYTVRDRARTFVEAADMLDYYFRDEPVFDDKAKAKFLVKDAAARLRALHEAFAAVTDWTEPDLEAAMNAHLAAAGLQIKDVAQPARVALTGRSASPGLFQVMFVLGRDASLARLAKAAVLADAG